MPRLLAPLAALGVAVACSSSRYQVSNEGAGHPSLTFPAHFADGDTGKPEADGGARLPHPASVATPESAASGEPATPAPARSATPSTPSSPPDPEPLVVADQWEFVFDYVKGDVRVASVRQLHLTRPQPTARRIGRFAVELYIGKELVDRVRFEFPLLAADAPPAPGSHRPLHDEPRFAPGAETTQIVLVPASPRATSALLVDRLTGSTWPIDWPPSPHAGTSLTSP